MKNDIGKIGLWLFALTSYLFAPTPLPLALGAYHFGLCERLAGEVLLDDRAVGLCSNCRNDEHQQY